MKSILKRTVCGIVSGVLSAGMLTFTANNANSGLLQAHAETYVKGLYYVKDGQPKMEVFDYGLDHYLDEAYSCTYDPQLAHMLSTIASGAANEELNEKNFDILGFSFENGGQFSCGSGALAVEYTIGTKNKDCLIVINDAKEISEDFLKELNEGYASVDEEGGFFKSFGEEAEEIYNAIPKGYERYIITGYGIGGAVGNITAKYVTARDNKRYYVFNYNFGVPEIAEFEESEFSDFIGINYQNKLKRFYDNIFNISHALDPVSYMQGENNTGTDEKVWWKYGVSMWFTDEDKDLAGLKPKSDDNSLSLAETYHNSARYVEYLKKEPDILDFRVKRHSYDKDSRASLDDFISFDVGDTVTVTEGDVLLKKVEIPEKYLDKPVTAIGKSAFEFCGGVTNVKLPDSITDIGQFAFSCCFNLKQINIPDGVTEIKSATFSDCRSLEKINIPDSLTTIGAQAFVFCLSLESLELPAGISNIGEYAFFECEGLQKINIPPNVTVIENKTFFYCLSLKEIVIHEDIEEIKDEAFYNCQQLRKVTIPASVKAIGERAFGYYEEIKPDSFFGSFGLIISGYAGTAAETYAKNNGIRFNALDPPTPGDFNGDASVDLKDVVLLRRYIAGGWNVDLDAKAADLNKDGNVNLKDVALLRRYIAGGWNVTLK